MPIEAVLRKIAASKKTTQINQPPVETRAPGNSKTITRPSVKPRRDPPFLSLIATQFKQVHAPIQLRPGVTIVNVEQFTERTLQDLAAYVAAANRGSKHWITDLLDEKLQALEICGFNAEIKRVH